MNKKFLGFFIAVFALLVIVFRPTPSYAAEDISLLDIKPYQTSSLFYVNKINGEPLTDREGNLIDTGVALTTSSWERNAAFATYNIKEMGYKTFKAKVSLDANRIVGDYGKTAIGIYADDVLLYEKQLTKNSGILPVNVKLPMNTSNFRIVIKQNKGGKGGHNVVLDNPSFSFEGEYKNTDKELPVSPNTIGAISNNIYYGYYVNQWSDNAFQDSKGNLVTDGFGLHSGLYGGSVSASYNIDQMGFNRFETKLSLDAAWMIGDYGRSAVGIYADDYLLYEKELTAKTLVQTVKLNIPKGTKNLRIVGKQIKGARGAQRIVFIHPLFIKTKDRLVTIPKTVSAKTVGASEYSTYYYSSEWQNTLFRYSNNKIAIDGVGLSTYSRLGGTGYAVYDIAGMAFNAFKTKLSLDSQWLTGDYGKSTVYIYGDKKLLYKRTLTKKDVKSLTLRFPSKTKKVSLKVIQKKGAKGTQGVVFGNAVFTKLAK